MGQECIKYFCFIRALHREQQVNDKATAQIHFHVDCNGHQKRFPSITTERPAVSCDVDAKLSWSLLQSAFK